MEEGGSVARRAGLTALGTLASRVLGMVRESVVAASFTVAQTDAFFIAFTIPNTLRMLLGEGAVSNAFVPVFSDVRTREGDPAAKRFFARFSGTLGTLLLVASVLGVVFAPALSTLYAGGFLRDPERFELVVSLTRVLFPFLALAGLAALATGALQVRGRFGVPAFAPALLNVAMIASPFLFLSLTERLGLPSILALAFGAIVGGMAMWLVQLKSLARLDLLPRPRLGFFDPEVRRALSLMAPLVLGLGIYQINMLLSRLFASFMPEGSQSYLSYGQRVIEIPQGMFALALASATLPTLSRLRSEGKTDELLALFRYSLRLTLFIAIPASALLIGLAEPVAAVLFGRGAFTSVHIVETGKSLVFQACGVWAVAGVRAVVPMFSAHQDTKTPVKASALNLVVFLATTTLLMGALSHVAIALANSLAAAVQLAVLLYALRAKLGALGLGEVVKSVLRTTLASVAMAAVCVTLSGHVSFRDAGELVRVSSLLGIMLVGGLTFLVGARMLKAPELDELLDAVRRRRKRAT